MAIQDKDNYNLLEMFQPTTRPDMHGTPRPRRWLFWINTVFGTNFATSGRRRSGRGLHSGRPSGGYRTTGPDFPLIGQGGNRLSGLGGDNDEW